MLGLFRDFSVVMYALLMSQEIFEKNCEHSQYILLFKVTISYTSYYEQLVKLGIIAQR